MMGYGGILVAVVRNAARHNNLEEFPVSTRLTSVLAVVFMAILGIAASASAQGLQTGTLSGIVKDPQDLPLPGATVTVTSSALQGERTAVSDAIGAYIIRGLPPGTYNVLVQFAGTSELKQTVVVPLGGVAQLESTLQLAGVTENVRVTADATPPALATTQTSRNFTKELLDTLPVGRRPFEIAELAPGVTDNTPNVGQMAIGGALAFDSLFLIDGVDTNDNLFGTSNNLFIEDAIQETQILIGGISAEYGRFGGGVVNVITKSGSNDLSGSFRLNFTNPKWSDETPFETTPRADILGKVYEFTVGGPIVRDRLWFFNADRYQASTDSGTFAELGGAYNPTTNNKRFELKLTGTPIPNHTVSGSYTANPTLSGSRPAINAGFSMTASTLINARNENKLWALNWNGAVTNSLFATFQWSKKQQSTLDAGGTSTNIIDSPVITRGAIAGSTANRHFNAPYFDATDPEDRNNRQFAGSLSHFLTSPAIGRHDLKVGFEHFKSFRTGGNSQSSTGYVINGDYLSAGGRPVIGSDGEPIPLWRGNAATPASAPTRITNWIASRGATLNVNTLSLYFQDRWTVAPRVTADVGVRYEKVRTDATGGIIGADTDTVVPRLGISADLTGDGQTVAQATYAQYSGRFTERAFGRNTTVGTPSSVTLAYVGPDGQGFEFAPAFNLANYVAIGGSFPTANIFFADGLTSPKTNEFTLSLGREFGRGGFAKGTYTWRSATDFIEDFINDPSAAGKIRVNQSGVSLNVDRVLYDNTDVMKREYQAVQLESRVRFTDKVFVEGHWTVQIRNHGNFEGEAANQPGNPSIFMDYPEMYSEARHYPFGRLDEFQRHKFRLWTSYNLGLGRAGSVDLAPIWRVNSGLTYSLAAAAVANTPQQVALNPGYLRTAGTSATLFFDERGSESFKGYGLLDFQARYGVPVWKTVQPWILFQVYNVMNNQKLIQWNTTVTPDAASAVDSLGLRTGYVKGGTFGTGTSAAHYPRWSSGENGGRTFRVAMGIRF
jgi:outer membrane receptor protein involved in Fe transport